jgi:hypothetical protein
VRRFPPNVRAVAAVLVLLALTTPTGCGQGFDRGAAVDSFRRANPEVSGEQAGCVVDRLVERYGLDGLVEELEADVPDAAFTEAQFQDMFACGVEGDVEAQIAEQLEASGVDPADAPCVAAAITADLGGDDIDVLLSGEITEEFMAKFVDAMDRCGAIEG